MKNYFFYQDPHNDHINGFECEIQQLSSITDLKEGFVLTTFEKNKVINLIPQLECSVDVLEGIELKSDDAFHVDFDQYVKRIEKSILFCENNDGKVVMSRIANGVPEHDFSLKDFFTKVCERYDHSFNYCFVLEDGSVWIGATPEVLIRSNDDKFIAYSLAGSRSVDNPFDWTNKEKEEQKMVTNEIRKVFEENSVSYEISGPQTTRAGNVEHLLTEFYFQSSDVLKIADNLHPTPAVCGIPKKEALEFIVNNEEHDRKFYAGIIGWKKGEELSLYVNLRCAEVTSTSVNCYVGGGITRDSDVQKEWEETNIKSQTLLSVLKKN